MKTWSVLLKELAILVWYLIEQEVLEFADMVEG